MSTTPRVLPPEPLDDVAAYLAWGGGTGYEAAVAAGTMPVLDELAASGLRGRGGAGFPAGIKWRTVAELTSPAVPTTVVVNAAEGEPGSFKDRAILRRNPWQVLEGALIACAVLGTDRLVVALKASFEVERARVDAAVQAFGERGWLEGLDVVVVRGPAEYLYGEETGLLEVVDGREPFPRIAPPFRHGVEEMAPDGARAAARVTMAAPGEASAAPPTLVNNVETFAHVPGIVAHGADWFREAGTEESPGTAVCTVSGDTRRADVAEVPLGTPLREVIEQVGGGAVPGHELVAALSGAANPFLPAALFDTPLTYEDMRDAGSGLGACGFIVLDDRSDLVAVAEGVSRFLAVESCGQCLPCKDDGLAIAELLGRVRAGDASTGDVGEIDRRLDNVAMGARCYLAQQHQDVVRSLLQLFPGALEQRLARPEEAPDPWPVAAIADLDGDRAVLDPAQADKQPDWTHGDTWSGASPAERSGLVPPEQQR